MNARMHHFTYIGPDQKLAGKGALGMWSRGHFKVQLDDCRFKWAQGWHRSARKDWQRTVSKLQQRILKALTAPSPWTTVLAGGTFQRGAGETIRSVVKGGL